MAERVVVAPADEIQPGGRRIVVPFRGRAGIGVFNVGGAYYALRNLCPHKSGPLCTGRIGGRIVSETPPSGRPLLVESHEVEREGTVIRCPWHLWEFDVTTGECLVDPKARVKMYPVIVEGGMVIVYADPADLPPQPPSF